jgi:hypothetical protein
MGLSPTQDKMISTLLAPMLEVIKEFRSLLKQKIVVVVGSSPAPTNAEGSSPVRIPVQKTICIPSRLSVDHSACMKYAEIQPADAYAVAKQGSVSG